MEKTFNRLGTMIDCSRNAVMNVKNVKNWIDITSDLGFNTLMLYTEDTYEVKEQPYFGYMRGRYTEEELKDIDKYAISKGVELIPCMQTLAHLDQIFRWNAYSGINDSGCLLVDDEKTYKFIDDMFAAISRTFTTKTVHIGMDEAGGLGRGRYLDIHGYRDRFEILKNHLYKVAEIAKKYNFELLMWGDMFFRIASNGAYNGNEVLPEDVSNMVPDNIKLVYWDYYSDSKQHYIDRIGQHAAVKDDIWFAGGLWTWTGFAPHNKYSIAITNAAFSACKEKGVKDVVLTMWGDNGAECSRYSVLPSLFYASELAKGNNDINSIKQKFADKYDIQFDDFMLLDLPGTPNSTAELSDTSMVNAEKYMLYNDCLLGLFDCVVKEGDNEKYAATAEKLAAYADNKQFGHIFASLSALCEALSYKSEIGSKTHKAYKSENKDALRDVLNLYNKALTALDKFYYTYREQWFAENKPEGFEVQDARLGGLYFRIRHCKERIEAYLNGEISEIPELEQTQLPFSDGGRVWGETPLCYNNWGAIISTSNK